MLGSIAAVLGVVALGFLIVNSIFLGVQLSNTFGGQWMVGYVPVAITLDVGMTVLVIRLMKVFTDRLDGVDRIGNDI